MMYKSIFSIFIAILLISIGCEKTDPVSIQATEESPDQAAFDRSSGNFIGADTSSG